MEQEEGKGKYVYQYSYDEIGNRTSYVETDRGKEIERLSYKYDAANQLLEANGNLIEKANEAGVMTYEYTLENRLKVVRENGELLMAASYDGDGNKAFQIDYTEMTYFVEPAPM